MTLRTDITALRTETLASLDEVHDYYEHSVSVWRLVQQLVREGRKFNIRNNVTGNTVDQGQLSKLAQKYAAEQVAEASLTSSVTIFEEFIFRVMATWLSAYPHMLSKNQLKFQTVIDAADKAEIVSVVVAKQLNELRYEPPIGWFTFLNRLVNLDSPTKEQVAQLAEVKATRDIIVHGRGIVNETYRRKAGAIARAAIGTRINVPAPYYSQSWRLLKEIVTTVGDSFVAKTS